MCRYDPILLPSSNHSLSNHSLSVSKTFFVSLSIKSPGSGMASVSFKILLNLQEGYTSRGVPPNLQTIRMAVSASFVRAYRLLFCLVASSERESATSSSTAMLLHGIQNQAKLLLRF